LKRVGGRGDLFLDTRRMKRKKKKTVFLSSTLRWRIRHMFRLGAHLSGGVYKE
jgi:hypothetical protein